MSSGYDLIVVGAGIVGLAHALAATRKGKKVCVIERNTKALGASIRNFGFITISGQKEGEHWSRARRSRDIWAEIAPKAKINIIHRGLIMPAYRIEAEDVLEAFLATSMGDDCRRISVNDAVSQIPSLRHDGMRCALYSPHELRVESTEALPKLAEWLEKQCGVDFRWDTSVLSVENETIMTNRGTLKADACVVCPGDDLSTLFPELIQSYGLKICTLQMLRVMPAKPTPLGAAVMSDLSYGRNSGFSDLEECIALKSRLDRELEELRKWGIHIVAVQSEDGSLVIGDSHIYTNHAEPFSQAHIDHLIMEAFDQLFNIPDRQITHRWCGTYASSSDIDVLIEKPAENIRFVLVTGGTGASTAFGLAEQVIAGLYGSSS